MFGLLVAFDISKTLIDPRRIGCSHLLAAKRWMPTIERKLQYVRCFGKRFIFSFLQIVFTVGLVLHCLIKLSHLLCKSNYSDHICHRKVERFQVQARFLGRSILSSTF